jgi:hypothetical protein
MWGTPPAPQDGTWTCLRTRTPRRIAGAGRFAGSPERKRKTQPAETAGRPVHFASPGLSGGTGPLGGPGSRLARGARAAALGAGGRGPRQGRARASLLGLRGPWWARRLPLPGTVPTPGQLARCALLGSVLPRLQATLASGGTGTGGPCASAPDSDASIRVATGRRPGRRRTARPDPEVERDRREHQQ